MRYFLNRRRQLQDWEAHPPIFWGLTVFSAGIMSLGFSLRWLRHPQLPILLIGIPAYELVVSLCASLFARIFKMRGRMNAALVFLNIGTWPLILSAPLTGLALSFPKLEWLWMAFGAFLFLKMMGNWRESLEVAYEFSSLQGTIVLALSGGLLTLFLWMIPSPF